MTKGRKGGGRRVQRILLGALALLVVTFAGLLAYVYWPVSEADELSIDQVYELAAKGEIRSAVLLEQDAVVIGQRCVEGGTGDSDSDRLASGFPAQRTACSPPVEPFQASYSASNAGTEALIWQMSVGGAHVTINPQRAQAIITQVTTYVYPVLFLVIGFGLILLHRSGEDSSGALTAFGSFRKGQTKDGQDEPKRSLRARLTRRKHDAGKPTGQATGVTFADVGGQEQAVTELREITDYLLDPERFAAFGAVAPRGALLFGPPGCGKTLMARAVAGEAGVPFFAVSGAEFVESLVGVGAARVRDLFTQVRQVAPAIVFIDEIDAVGRKRGGDGGGGGEREQTINQLLVEMDGFDVSSGIVLMGATNRPDILDPALMRPGRFDRHVTLEPPDPSGREEILRMHAAGKPLADDVDFGVLARRTPGFTGADLANVVNEAALLAMRRGAAGERIDLACFGDAVERVLHGPQRRGSLLHPDERRRLAYHESGHALVAAALGQGDDVQRVSVLARGRSLASSVMAGESSDRVLVTEDQYEASLAIAMAGIAAEGMTFARPSSTAADDLDKANAIAKEMIGVQGMSAEIGPLRLLRSEEGYLGSEVRLVQTVSGQTLGVFDAAVRTRIEQARTVAEHILAANPQQVEAMVEELATKEVLEGEALRALLQGMPTYDLTVPDGAASNGQGAQVAGSTKATRSGAGRAGSAQAKRS